MIAMTAEVAQAATRSESVSTSSSSVRTVKHHAKKKAKLHRAKKSAAAAKVKKTEELQTDVKFDESVLHGQYQVPEEALAKVEDEKALSDLIGVRKHFKDRLATASEQE